MVRYVDPLVHNAMLDANLLDEVASGTSAAVNRILELFDGGEVIIVLPHSVCDELNHPATPTTVRAVASRFIYSMPVELTALEIASRNRLLKRAQGSSQSKNVERDLNHIFEASKYGGGHFITRDNWLLRNAERLWTLAQIEVLTPEEFVEKTEVALKRREVRDANRENAV